MLKTDFHTHAGVDSNHALAYSPKQLIGRMAKLGYDAVAITNHDRVTFSNDLKGYAKKRGILLIPGIEKGIEGKEAIILNVTKNITQKVKTFDDLERCKDENIFVIAPHPFYPDPKALHSKLLENIKLFDGIEFSHFYIKWLTFNTKAVKIAERYRLPLVGTSDCHMFEQLNRTYSMVDSGKSIDSVFEAMRKRKTRLITEPLPFLKALKILTLLYLKY